MGFENPFEERQTYGSVQTEMNNTQTPFTNNQQRKTTFYGQLIPSPNLSMQVTRAGNTASRENSQSFSFGLGCLTMLEAPEGRGSLGRVSQPLIVPEPMKSEARFPSPRSGRGSSAKRKEKSQKRGQEMGIS